MRTRQAHDRDSDGEASNQEHERPLQSRDSTPHTAGEGKKQQMDCTYLFTCPKNQMRLSSKLFEHVSYCHLRILPRTALDTLHYLAHIWLQVQRSTLFASRSPPGTLDFKAVSAI